MELFLSLALLCELQGETGHEVRIFATCAVSLALQFPFRSPDCPPALLLDFSVLNCSSTSGAGVDRDLG